MMDYGILIIELSEESGDFYYCEPYRHGGEKKTNKFFFSII